MIVLPQEIQAARLRLVKERPYLASAAWALQPVSKPELGTMAVDMWWRLYFDPAVVQQWSVEELTGVLYHEISHLLRDHASRMKGFDPRLANIAADAEINDDILGERFILPRNPITPASIGQPNGLLAEEYYEALEQAQQSAPCQGTSVQSENSDQGQGSSSADRGSSEENQSNPSSTAEGGSQASGTQSGDRSNDFGSIAGDCGGSQSGDGEGSMSASSSGQPSNSSAQPGSLFQPPATPGSGHGGGKDGSQPGDRAQTPAPGAGHCGSCATGQQEPWEEGPPGEGTSPGISRAEAELIRRDVARQIKEHIQARGNVPRHWTRWAEERLRPKVDWRKELATAVRHAIADIAGASDYSYRRPSRRQGQVGNGKVVLPALRRPLPSVAVVVDTSGSISDSMLSQALAEISGILKELGQREGVHVLACDAHVQACCRVFRPEQVQLAGGGGTDMGAGLYAASKLRPVPQVCIVITDGYTPWPAQPPKGMKVIVTLTGDGNAPEWAKIIKIEEGK